MEKTTETEQPIETEQLTETEQSIETDGFTETEQFLSDEFERARNAKMPKRGRVVDGKRRTIGKIKRQAIYDEDGKKLGSFIQTSECIFYVCEGDDTPCGFLTEDDEILSFDGELIGKIYKRLFPLSLYFFKLTVALVGFALYLVFPYIQTKDLIQTIAVIDENGVTWQIETKIDVFGNIREKDKTIAPGSKGKYAFRIENRARNATRYAMTFQTLAGDSIHMGYKLSTENGYLHGGENDYFYADGDRMPEMTLKAGGTQEFLLEWEWIDASGFDSNDWYYSIKIIIDYTFINGAN